VITQSGLRNLISEVIPSVSTGKSGNTLEAIGIGKDFSVEPQQHSNKEKGWTNGTS
jgi:hypothetical protein